MSTPRPYQRSDFLRQQNGKRFFNLQTGQTLSRRQYQKAIGKPLPAHVAQPRQGKGPSKLYVASVRRWSQGEPGIRPPQGYQQAKSDPLFQTRWRRLRQIWRWEKQGRVIDYTPLKGRPMYEGPQGQQIDYTPRGEYAQLLEDLLGRPHGAGYYVGDS